MTSGRRLRLASGAALALTARRVLRLRLPDPAWMNVNHAGRAVDLVNGPALGLTVALTSWRRGTSLRAAAATVTAVGGAAVIGRYDDVHGDRPGQRAVKGLRGHVGALSRGRLSTGAVKLVSLPAVGLIAARIGSGRGQRRSLLVVDGCLIAGSANLANLLDLRPGRTLKAFLVAAGPVVAAGGARREPALGAGVGAALALLPSDLRERAMLGDCGANALGALLGIAATRLPAIARTALLAGIVALTLQSERRSFSDVIAAHPSMRRIDEWGRVPAR